LHFILKVMPPIFLCWPTTLEADAGGMAVEVEPCRATDSSKGAVWQNGIWHVSAYEAEVWHWIPPCRKKIARTDIHECLLNIYGNQTVDVSTARRFSSGDSDIRDRLHSRQPFTAVSSWNEEPFNQLICENWQITTRELCMELNVGTFFQSKAREEHNLSPATQ
jgi:hypothetical protein